VVEDFTIADEADIQHLVDHHPRFTWGYFEVVERPQARYQIQVLPLEPDGSTGEEPIWNSGEVSTDRKEAVYAGKSLQDGASYLARLRVYSGFLWSEGWNELRFRMNGLPTAPQLLAPAEGEIVTTFAPCLTAEVSTDGEGDRLVYDFEVYSAGEAATPVQDTAAVPPQGDKAGWRLAAALTENHTYRFRVRASDPFENGPWSDLRTFHVNVEEEPPATFSLREPSDGADVYLLHPTLRWEPAVDPDPLSSVGYELEISKIAEPGAARTYTGIAATEFTLPDSLDNRAVYQWRVTAVDNTGMRTECSGAQRFRVDTTPSVPVPTAALNGEERKPDDALAWWGSTDPNPDDRVVYDVEICDAADCARAAASVEGWGDTRLPVNAAGGWESLTDNTVYYWRVRARDNHNAASDFSAAGSFFFNQFNDAPNPIERVTSPPDTVTGTTAVRFEWQPASDPDLSDTPGTLICEIEATTGDFEGGEVRRFASDPGATSLTHKLDDNHRWRYRIRVRDDEGASSQWSSVGEVLVNVAEDPPRPFGLLSPPDGAAIAELDSLVFEWESSSDPDWRSKVTYRLELTPESGAGFSVVVDGTSFKYKGGLANQAAYRWRVTAVDNTGLETPCRGEFGFTTSTV